MSIIVKEISSTSAETPSSGEMTLFVDAADDKLKRKDPTGAIHLIEPALSAVNSVFGRAGDVTAQANDYSYAQISGIDAGVDARITAQKGAANGLATLDGTQKIPLAQIPESLKGNLNYQGTWDASTNSPTIQSGVGSKGYYRVVNVAGNTSIDGESDWNVHDWIVFNGTIWEKIDNTDKVVSVAGKTGAVTLDKSDVGLSNVDNTSDSNKPISTATQTALNAKLNAASNLSDLQSVTTARTNLGLGSAALNNTGDFAPIAHVGSGGSAHAVATGSSDGFMSSSDKSKLDGIQANATAGITQLTGEVIATGPGSSVASVSNAAVIAKVLTAFAQAAGVVTSADSILQALQKLAGTSTLTSNTISNDVTVPDDYTWLRQNRTVFSGTAKITLLGTGKLTFHE